jgi:transcriptional regulator with XRE-family HTH domain
MQDLIRYMMASKDISGYQLSKKSGVSEATISKWLSKKQSISLENFLKIFNALK